MTDVGGLNDRSFNQSSWAGLQLANKANSNIAISYVPSASQNDYAPNLAAQQSKGCGTIIAVDDDEYVIEETSKELGERWETPRIAYKPFPVCHFMHGSLGATDSVGHSAVADNTAPAAPAARAGAVEGDERERLWQLMVEIWPDRKSVV